MKALKYILICIFITCTCPTAATLDNMFQGIESMFDGDPYRQWLYVTKETTVSLGSRCAQNIDAPETQNILTQIQSMYERLNAASSIDALPLPLEEQEMITRKIIEWTSFLCQK